MAEILCDKCGEAYDEDEEPGEPYYDGYCDECLNEEFIPDDAV